MPVNERERAWLVELLRERSFEQRRVVLASGKESDFFIDCKQTVLTAEGHGLVASLMLDTIEERFSTCQAVAGVELHHFYLALIALGMGWNFSYVGATSLLGTTHTRAEQAKVQGLNDFLVLGLVAVGSFGSGALLNTYGWTAVQYAMAPALLLALAGIAWLALVARSTE